MEQTALRPKPMPGRESGRARAAPGRRPHAARRRTRRRLRTLLLGLLAGTVLVLSGVGLGTVGATVIGMSRLAELQRRTEAAPEPRTTATVARGAPGPVLPAPPTAALGVEAVDAEKAGALLVGVHVPGPGHTAGLVRGDILLTFAGTRVDTAADLVRAVDTSAPGKPVTITVRHESGGYQQLSVTPALVT
ncbi:PDZ domain-containing protein [Streptomyces sp. NPDC004610]|uniref:PDZ domain-containing protein n=1 Tax=unclassified Streptomyces TaxID=2593676 RepID=UPI0033A485E5